MSRLAYRLTERTSSLVAGFSDLNVRVHPPGALPTGPKIYLPNYFTCLEALLLPCHLASSSGAGFWTLADASFYPTTLPPLLELFSADIKLGPDLDFLAVKTLLSGSADWLVFPPLPRQKAKRRGCLSGVWPPKLPSSQAIGAFLALRVEFFRQRLQHLLQAEPQEAQRLIRLFEVEDPERLIHEKTWLVPVNIGCYPARGRERLSATLAELSRKQMTPRLCEEVLAQGKVIFSGLDVDIRYGEPVEVGARLGSRSIRSEIVSTGRISFHDRLSALPELRKEALRLGRECLTASYSLRTFNHDQLFASLLAALPARNVAERDFCRRGFLLASTLPGELEPQLHSSLLLDQSHLLSDDRYLKYRNFLAFALEQGALRHEGGELVPDRAKLAQLERVLVGNTLDGNRRDPIRGALRRSLLVAALLPDRLLRRMVAATLERLALREFQDDYAEFYKAGISKEPQVGSPVLLKGRSRKLGVVLVHGFMSAPREVAELAQYLHGRGLWVYQVRLKGHGTAPEDLARTQRPQWVRCVDAGYALMSSSCEKVVVGGFSFGGGVALDCASRVKDLAGVFAVCPPHRLMDISSRFEPAVTAWNRVMEVLRNRWAKLEFVDTLPERPQINYARLPVAGLRELARFMRELEPKLATVTVPVLVLQSEADPVVDPRGTWRLFQLLGSSDKRYLKFAMTRHGILAGPGSEEVHAAIGEFLERIAGESGP